MDDLPFTNTPKPNVLEATASTPESSQTRKLETWPAGHRVGPWIKAVGISHSGLYALKPELRPRSVAVGRRRIITEAPSDWLARVGKPM